MMLSFNERMGARKELQENFKRLDMNERAVLAELHISGYELHAVLNMKNEDPALVWIVKDYLEDKLTSQGKEVYPFATFDSYRGTSWYDTYATSWKKQIS